MSNEIETKKSPDRHNPLSDLLFIIPVNRLFVEHIFKKRKGKRLVRIIKKSYRRLCKFY